MVKGLAWFTPWPPMPNGIADYSYRVARELASSHNVVAYTDMEAPRLPKGVTRQSLQDDLVLPDDVCPVYQIGNNQDHRFVFRQALKNPGIVVLHDLSLLYLVENMGLDTEIFYNELAKSNPVFAPLRAASIASGLGSYKSDHALFRMLNTLVGRSRRIVVHTRYAKNILIKTLGSRYAERIHIIPHFAIMPDSPPRDAMRARLALPKDAFVVVTSGFATAVKRFDWLIEALARVAKTNRRLLWVQAGPTRPDEYDLENLVAQNPDLARVTRFTGYLPEDELDAYISAADLFVNLRYPSVGESSGSLARALAAGAACVVTDTAGYREFPDDVLFKISPEKAAHALEELVLVGMADPAAFAEKREAAKKYALDDLSLARYARDFEQVIEAAMSDPSERETGTIFAPSADDSITRLGPFSLRDLDFGRLSQMPMTSTLANSLRIRKENSEWYIEIIRKA